MKELEHSFRYTSRSPAMDGMLGKTRALQCVENMDARFRDFGIFETRRISESSRVGENGAHFFGVFALALCSSFLVKERCS